MHGDWRDVAAFLLKALVISLSGVMAPGPVTAATVAAGTRQRHAGGLIALGHGAVELPLAVLILLGVGRVFRLEMVKIGIGLVGGGFLLLMGGQMLAGLGKGQTAAAPAGGRHPFWTGVILSGGNPYFLLWWATIGLALATQAAGFGLAGFALFALVHWLCDLAWLEALSWATFKGSALLGGRPQKVVLAVCAAALLVFGVMFIYAAAGKLLAGGAGN